MGQDFQTRDMMELLERLEAQVAVGKRVPLSNRIMVEEEEFVELLDQLRQAIPGEIQQARRVLQDRQKIIIEAQHEAANILVKAKERADYLVSQQGVMAEARYRGEDQLRKARDDARRSMSEVDSYAKTVLDKVERVIRENLADIERAKGTLPQAH